MAVPGTTKPYASSLAGQSPTSPLGNCSEITARDLRAYGDLSGFVGLKFWPDYHYVPVNSSKYQAALEFAEEQELLVLVHTFGESPFDSPDLLGEAAARHPRAPFLMGHSGYGEWERSVAIARDLPNVYLDLTSVVQALDFSQMPGGSLMPRVPVISPHVNGLIEYMVETAGSQKDCLRQRSAVVQPALPRRRRALRPHLR